LAATEAALATPADVVIVDRIGIFYGLEIPRNGPYAAERPVVMMLNDLSGDQVRRLCSTYRVAVFGVDQAKQVGLPTRTVEEALATSTDTDSKILQELAKYREKYDFLTSGACAELGAQQRISGASGNPTVGEEGQ
jgi:hypothetical protein